MSSSNKIGGGLFLPDDFFKIDDRFFRKLRAKEDINADPSYWYDSESPVSDVISKQNIHKYRIDYDLGLKNEKYILIDAISHWDNQCYDYNNITVCSSATTASFIVLGFLQKKVKSLIFETPAYYASIVQAKKLGFTINLIPTYFSSNFQIDKKSIQSLKEIRKPKAIWLSQPRFGLGINQCQETLLKIINCLTDNDYIIIDEATEQLFPAYLHDLNFKNWKNVIKLRSFLKPIGLNGPRLSYILHHSDSRSAIQCQLELVQGAIDCFSLEFTCNILKNETNFKEMLLISNKHVNNMRRNIELITRGTCIKIIPLVNGYIGSIAIKIYNKGNYLPERKRLLFHCKKLKVPIILGSSMYFAIDKLYEFIRINYFNSEYNITNGIQLILKFS